MFFATKLKEYQVSASIALPNMITLSNPAILTAKAKQVQVSLTVEQFEALFEELPMKTKQKRKGRKKSSPRQLIDEYEDTG